MKTVSVMLSDAEIVALRRFLSRVQYGDVYRHVEHNGDGNRRGSASDQEVRTTQEAIRCVNGALRLASE